MVRVLAMCLVELVLIAALLIGPAWVATGTLDWPRGWLGMEALALATVGGGVWIQIVDPELTRERATLQAPTSRADTVATALIALTAIGWFVAAAWDACSLRLIEIPGAVSLWSGVAAFAAGNALILWVLRVNSFAAAIVKVQAERRQVVIDTGPYARVRHPMYLGAILFFAGLGLILDSPAAALLALPLFAAAFTPRMRIEEEVLRRELDGYEAYQARVRARLAPGIL